MKRCLYCYLPLSPSENDYHATCSRKIFGQATPPDLPYSEADFEPLAVDAVRRQISVTGAQPKLSLHIGNDVGSISGKRFTIVGLWGGYIMKPPAMQYPELPETEDLTMHLASIAGIRTIPHSLIRLASGNLAYITKRVDRKAKTKLAMEDMCQLTERLIEDKYQGSYEQIAKTIQKYSAAPGLNVATFWEVVLFSFLTGNADMHLKNFSLLDQNSLGMQLSPAYDLVNTALVLPADQEELALMLNGRKKNIRKADFVKAMEGSDLDQIQQANIFKGMVKAYPKWMDFIDHSFLSDRSKEKYKSIIADRMVRLQLQ